MKAECTKNIDDFYQAGMKFKIKNYTSSNDNIIIEDIINGLSKTESMKFLRNTFELIPENET